MNVKIRAKARFTEGWLAAVCLVSLAVSPYTAAAAQYWNLASSTCLLHLSWAGLLSSKQQGERHWRQGLGKDLL